MVRHPMRKLRPNIDHPEVVDQKLRKLECPRRHPLRQHLLRLAGEKHEVKLFQHGGARSGWNHHCLGTFEPPQHRTRNFPRLGPKTGIEGRLATAGDRWIENYMMPKFFEQPEDRFGDLRKDKVDVTRNEESCGHPNTGCQKRDAVQSGASAGALHWRAKAPLECEDLSSPSAAKLAEPHDAGRIAPDQSGCLS